MYPPPPRRRKRTSSGADRRKRMAEQRRASAVCAAAIEEVKAPRTALWDAARPPTPTAPTASQRSLQSVPSPPAPPKYPHYQRCPRRHDDTEDAYRARLAHECERRTLSIEAADTALHLRDRLTTDDRMNLACECARRGVAFHGDDGAETLERRLAQDHQLELARACAQRGLAFAPTDDVPRLRRRLGPAVRTYGSPAARKLGRAARRKSQRRANKALGRAARRADGALAKSSAALRAAIRHTIAARVEPVLPHTLDVLLLRAAPTTRSTSLDALDAAWPAWGREPELVETRRRAAATMEAADAARLQAEILDTRAAWAAYAVSAAEAERSRRIAVDDELDWANQLERERRQKWALDASKEEQRRRIREGFAREAQGTRWFEGLLGKKDEDYEVVCPYSKFGCRHCGPRSQIGRHLESCPARIEKKPAEIVDKDYEVVCPNSFMGCCATFPLSHLQTHLQTCPFSDASRASERSTRNDAQLQALRDVEQERARRLRDEGRSALARAAARVARRKGLAPQVEVMKTARIVSDEVRGAGLRRLGAELRETALAAAAAALARGYARSAAIRVIDDVARRVFGSAQAKVFGSCAYGLDAASSDVDLVITNWCDGDLSEDRPYVAYVLLRFAQHLRAEPSVVVDRVLDRARVPVIRATIYVDGGSVPVDVSLECASHTGFAAAALGRSLVDEVSQLAPVAVAVRALLRKAGLNDAYTGGLPSYAVLLMLYYATLNGDEPRSAKKKPVDVLNDASWVHASPAEHLLRATPTTPHRKKSTASESLRPTYARSAPRQAPAPPPRRAAPPSSIGGEVAKQLLARGPALSNDDAALATTLLNFLRLFGRESRIAVSVRDGGRRLAHGDSLGGLFVEDPLDVSNNVARAAFRGKDVLALFARAHDRLREALLVHGSRRRGRVLDALFVEDEGFVSSSV